MTEKNKAIVIIIIVILTLSIIIISETITNPEKKNNTKIIDQNLSDIINTSDSVMWIGPHADDEIFNAGTLGYLTKDLGYAGTIVAFGKKSARLESNNNSSEFLNMEYIRIADTIYPDVGSVNFPENSISDCLDLWLEDGTKDELVEILMEKQPDIVFSFEPESQYTIFPLSHAASATIVSMAIEEAGIDCYHFYTLHTIHMKTEEAEDLEELNVTDVIDLNETLWNYKMTVIGFYADNYQTLQRIVEDQEHQDSLVHKDLFRKTSK